MRAKGNAQHTDNFCPGAMHKKTYKAMRLGLSRSASLITGIQSSLMPLPSICETMWCTDRWDKSKVGRKGAVKA